MWQPVNMMPDAVDCNGISAGLVSWKIWKQQTVQRLRIHFCGVVNILMQIVFLYNKNDIELNQTQTLLVSVSSYKPI